MTALTGPGSEPQPGLDWMRPAASLIASIQREDGSIPWFEGHYADPWDHVEAAMGLAVAGQWRRAERAYEWLAETQREDGSWWNAYRDGAACAGGASAAGAPCVDSNFCAYVATGVWHHFLVTGERAFLRAMWPTVRAAIDWTLGLQTEHGDIPWAVNQLGEPEDDALLAGCCSIHRSVLCAERIARQLGFSPPGWSERRELLGRALREKPQRFDRRRDRANFSMDWFYPVLTGVLTGAAADARLRSRWSEFVVPGLGCRCVSEEPWVTVAESCELVMALVAANQRSRARVMFEWLHKQRAADGAYWTGYQFVEGIFWPEGEKPTWTAGAMLLAADALYSLTPAAGMLYAADR